MLRPLLTLLGIISCVSCTPHLVTDSVPISTKPPSKVQAALNKFHIHPELIDGKYRVIAEEKGEMSWYSVKTNGGTETASGEKFSNQKATAAHKKLKMGTMVRVTNLRNGKARILKINDRGPFKPGRIIDVSIGMAQPLHLNFEKNGIAPCKVEVLEKIH